MKRTLKNFQGGRDFNLIKAALWLFISNLLNVIPLTPKLLRIEILRIFGAKVGFGVVIRRSVRIKFPWNLEIGDNCWIGEEVWFINHEKIVIGSDVCISQRSMICSSGHDYRSATLKFAHKPIRIKNGVWICMDSKILPGVTIGECSVISAGEVVRNSVPDYSMFIDGQSRRIQPPR